MVEAKKSRLLEGLPANLENVRNRSKDTPFIESEHKYLIFENCPDLLPVLQEMQRIALTRENPSIRQSLLKGLRTLTYALGQQLEQLSGLYTDIDNLNRKIARLQALVQEYAEISGVNVDVVTSWLRNVELSKKAVSDLTRKLQADGFDME